QNMASWMQGDFSMIMSGNYELMYVTIPILVIAYVYANQFTIAGMGEDFASNLGLNYRQVVNIGLIIVALVTASVVLSVGVIPFRLLCYSYWYVMLIGGLLFIRMKFPSA